MAEIYLDNAATTPPSAPVIDAVHHALATAWGNPSDRKSTRLNSSHQI